MDCNIVRTFFCLVLTTVSIATLAQQTGDEDSLMMVHKAKARDQQAIDEAVNGWWTESMKSHDVRIDWWRKARFGMFVHWGIYSLPGGEWNGHKVSGYAEHLMRKEKISRSAYLDIARQFNPIDFNADEWIRSARNAGMMYFIITAKHHDGFAMYDSKVSDFNIIRQTPFQRDPMAELAAACRKYGVKFGFYYSHAFDWEHPLAPGNDWEYKNPGGDLNLYGGRNWYDLHPEMLPSAVRYVDEKAIPQIRELLQKYHPDILWFDTPHKLPLSENIRILKSIREIDKNVVVNGRLARTESISFGDYKNTADRPAEFYPVEGDWEAIPTTNESYGYHKFDRSHKPVAHFIRLMANAASRGGNLLMNIGPMGNGKFDPKDVEILAGISRWMAVNRESIGGTLRTPLPLQSWGTSTLKAQKLYLHVFDWPQDRTLIVGGLRSQITKAYLLSDVDKKSLQIKKLNSRDWAITVPRIAPDSANTVIVVESRAKILCDTVRLLTGQSPQRLLAFDARQRGKGLGYGDGKSDRYYVTNFNNETQSLIWNFRVNEPRSFDVEIKYVATPGDGGAVQFRLNDQNLFQELRISDNEQGTVSKKVGTLILQPGTHTLSVSPTTNNGHEIMKLLELVLVPNSGR